MPRLAIESDPEDISPEQRLFAAVILQALYDATSTPSMWDEAYMRHMREASRLWLTTDSQDFRTVCDLAHFDSSAIVAVCRRLQADNWERTTSLEPKRPRVVPVRVAS